MSHIPYFIKNKGFTLHLLKRQKAGIFLKLFKKGEGFTLAEMLVTVLIFSIIIGVVTGVFISAIRMQKYDLTYQQLLNQTGYAMEYMDRMIRMAKKDDGTCLSSSNLNYEYPKTIPGGGGASGLMFRNQSDICKGFFLQDGQLKEYEKDRMPSSILGLTSDDFKITSLKFNVLGDEAGDNLQPRVTIFMAIEGKGSGSQPKIKIQTTISQRDLDE